MPSAINSQRMIMFMTTPTSVCNANLVVTHALIRPLVQLLIIGHSGMYSCVQIFSVQYVFQLGLFGSHSASIKSIIFLSFSYWQIHSTCFFFDLHYGYFCTYYYGLLLQEIKGNYNIYDNLLLDSLYNIQYTSFLLYL